MSEQLVSIITPLYNSSQFISDTIRSVLNQSYQNWEMIIVDDNSSDDSVEIINKIRQNDIRIKLITLNINVGAAEARNVALRVTRGNYIAFLDSDDLWLPSKLEKQLLFMEKNNYAFSFTAFKRISENNDRTFNTIKAPNVINYKKYLKNTVIGSSTVVINKKLTGYFEMPNIRSSHDMALWLDIFKRGFKAYGLNEILAYYRVVSNSNTSKKLSAIKDVWKVYRNIENLNFIYSIYNFIHYAINASLRRL